LAIAAVPLGRIGTPDDLGKAAVFFAFDDSTYVTGIELFVDGGVAQIWRSQDDAQVAPIPGSLRSTAPTVLGR
jgi:enoyl-[acyl-carrier-protein] reductase (NADH)